MTCEFCETLRMLCNLDRNREQGETPMHDEYSAALVVETYTDREHRFRGQTTNHGYKLRFCPECGASITRRMRQWKCQERKPASACGFGGQEP